MRPISSEMAKQFNHQIAPARRGYSATRASDGAFQRTVACAADLTKLDRNGFGVLARQALESPHVVVWFVARLDARKKHRQVTRRTVSLRDRSLGRVKTVWLRHDARLLNFPIPKPRYVCRKRQGVAHCEVILRLPAHAMSSSYGPG